MLRLKRAAAAVAILAVAACSADSKSPLAPDLARPTISDAAHSGAVPGFYFLPPTVPQPSYSGTFDAALQPRVEICELSGSTCVTTVATFTFGTGSSSVRVDAAGQNYIVNWKTSDYNLDVNKNYRISVYQGAFLLGYADVDVVGTAKDLKNVDTGQYIALLDDRTLPIKFRVETGIPAQVSVSPPVDSIDVGETAQFTASCTDLHGNPVTCPATTWSSSSPAIATIDASGLATGVNAGTVTITASIGYAQGTAQLTVIQPNTPPVANADTFQAIGNVTIPVAAPGVLANDTDTETPGGLQAVPGTVATANGGTATIAADGSFTYLSAAGFTGTDSFSYTVTDGSLTATATVTVSVPTRVWYVSNASAGGDGRDASPFGTLAAAEGPSAAGETIFLLYGNGTTVGYDAGFSFKNGQALTGQGVPADVTAVVNGQTVVLLEAGSTPTTTSASGATLRLAQNNTAQGLNVNSAAGAGIAGSGFGTFTASVVNVAAIGGPSLDLQNGTVAGSFASLSSANSTTSGLRLASVGGTLSAPAGVVSGAAGAGVDVSDGNAGVSYGGSITGSGTHAASVTGRTGGTLTLSGDITDTNGGILVQNNTGGTIAFNGASKSLSTGANNGVTLASNAGATVNFGGGGLAIATTTGTGFSATGGGTVNVTGAGNTIAAGGATALSVVNTTIGASGLSFRSISAANAANGIVLDNTGATNGLQVTGSGVAGSGGTISGMSGDGVSLTSANAVRLAWMLIQNNLGNGISGSSVTDVRVENSQVLNNADNAAVHEAGIRFDNLFGTSAIDNTTVSGSIEDNVRVVNTTGTLTLLSVSGSTIRDNSAAAPGRYGLLLSSEGAAAMTVTVQNSHLIHNRIAGVEANTQGAGVLDVTVTGGSVRDNGVGVDVVHNSTGALTYHVLNIGTITGQGLVPINVNRLNTAGAASTFAGTISGNVIGTVGVTNSGAAAGPGIRVQSGGMGGTLTTAITNNTIREVTTRGIDILARDGGSTINATVTGNTVTLTSPISLEGIRLDAGALTTDAVKVCAAISGNTATTAGASAPIRVRQRFAGTTFQLAGYAGSATADASVVSYLTSTNTVASALADHGGAGFIGVASCPTP